MMESKAEDRHITILTDVYTVLPVAALARGRRRVELDLGCGKGSFTTRLAQRDAETLVLAADVMIGRLRKLVKRNEREQVDNIVALRVEARMLLGIMLPDRCLDRLHILCPDPWPKGRHRGNRLLCSDFLTQVHRVLKSGGHWHFSTDDMNYLEQVRQVVAASGLFEERPEQLAALADLKSDFEERWESEGKTVHHHLWVGVEPPPVTIGH